MLKNLQQLSLFGIAVLSAFAAHAQAAPTTGATATTNFTASATVVQGLTMNLTSNMNFGSILSQAQAGTVSLSATNIRTTTGGIVAVGGNSVAGFSVTGNPSTAYTVTLPPASTLTGPGQAMAIAFSTAQVTGGNLTRTLSNAGSDSFNVGATLSVNANQVAGAYSGVFPVTVSY